LAASFDLIQEGQEYGSGSWVVTGILAGGVFIWLCKKVMMILHVLCLPFFLLIEVTCICCFISAVLLCTDICIYVL